MKKNVYDYFVNFDKKQLPTKDGIISVDNQRIKQSIPYKNFQGISDYTIDNIPVYARRSFGLYEIDPRDAIILTASQMYNNIGIITPPAYLMLDQTDDKTIMYTITQDVTSINHFETIQAIHAQDYPQTRNCFYNINYCFDTPFKWELLYNESIKEEFLQYVTEDCYNELINLFLLGELRTDTDLHRQNYFLYKTPGAPKYEGVIPIDLERVRILSTFGSTKEKFLNFVKNRQYETYTPTEQTDEPLSHEQRMKNICRIIQDGKLSPSNIQLLKSALSYDLPKSVKDLYAQSHETFPVRALSEEEENEIVIGPISYLWEYNNETVGRELGL